MKPTKENLKSIPIKEFAKKTISDGHLYLRTSEGRRFYLMKPGILVDQSFVKKHATLNTVFEMDQVSNESIIEKFSSLFRELRYLQFERDLRLKSAEIVKQFQNTFSHDEHFLSFALACHREFCGLSSEEISKMSETDVLLFRKALYSGAFAIIIALTNDFYHFPMLKDFYNISLALDIGLCDEHYSYFVGEACNQENQMPGSGLAWMKRERASDIEQKVFLSHPEKSYQLIKSNKSLLAYPELAEIMLYQHELSDGKGFPRGISKGQVSSWEAVVILADSFAEIRDAYDFEKNVLGFIENFHNKKLSDLPVQRVYQKLCMSLEYFFKQKTGS